MKTNQCITAVMLAIAGVLTLQSTAAASVVHTGVNATVSGTGYIKIDLNHDGITDFVLHSSSVTTLCGNRGGQLDKTNIKPTLGDGVVVSHSNQAALLARGIPINANSTFYQLAAVVAYFACESRYIAGYLGLEFQINGHTHYGWAHIIVNAPEIHGSGLTTTLVDVAYETIAGHAINTGQTLSPSVDESGDDASTVPESFSPRDASYLPPHASVSETRVSERGSLPSRPALFRRPRSLRRAEAAPSSRL
jgi:hypothetical protein